MQSLSLADVVNLKNNPSEEARQNVAEKICEQFNTQQFTEEESVIVSEIFRLLAKDVEISIRRTLSEKLKRNDRLPQDIAFLLANDVLQVSLPVLEYSPVLSEEDLVMIARGTKELEKLQAIAKRDMVTPPVSREIINSNMEDAVITLMDNEGASIATGDYRTILEEYGRSEPVLKGLVGRANLPASIAHKLVGLVSDTLRKELEEKYGIFKDVVAGTMDEAVEEIVIDQTIRPAAIEEKVKLAEHMNQTHQLNSSVVIRSLCKGDLNFFAASISELTGKDVAEVQQQISEGGDEAFSKLYQEAGFPDSVYEATKLIHKLVVAELNNGTSEEDPQFATNILMQITDKGYDQHINNMPYMMTLIGRPGAGQAVQ